MGDAVTGDHEAYAVVAAPAMHENRRVRGIFEKAYNGGDLFIFRLPNSGKPDMDPPRKRVTRSGRECRSGEKIRAKQPGRPTMYRRGTIEASVRITISTENYLKAIAEAESEGENVKPVTLSRWLRVSAPAVTMAIKRLKRDGLIQVHAGANITLSSSGWEIANRLLYRHHLIERMLAEIFGLEWYKVHEEAEALEHAVSGDFERKLSEKLGNCCLCPHGNLAMDSPRERRGRGLKPLEESHGRERVRVASVFERDAAFLEYLDAKGIRPGVWVEVLGVGDDIAVQTDGAAIHLDRAAGAKVWVSAAKPGVGIRG